MHVRKHAFEQMQTSSVLRLEEALAPAPLFTRNSRLRPGRLCCNMQVQFLYQLFPQIPQKMQGHWTSFSSKAFSNCLARVLCLLLWDRPFLVSSSPSALEGLASKVVSLSRRLHTQLRGIIACRTAWRGGGFFRWGRDTILDEREH